MWILYCMPYPPSPRFSIEWDFSFYRVGGGTRIAGFLLAIATAVLLWIGTWPIAFIRMCWQRLHLQRLNKPGLIAVMVVGSLIFVLGLDLVKEALWDTRQRVNRCVIKFDISRVYSPSNTGPSISPLWASWFAWPCGISSLVCCLELLSAVRVWQFCLLIFAQSLCTGFFFVVQNSQRRSIRAIFTGETAISAVRRPSLQRAYVREVSKQTTILRLQGMHSWISLFIIGIDVKCRVFILWHHYICGRSNSKSNWRAFMGPHANTLPGARPFSGRGIRHVILRGLCAHSATTRC